MCNNTISNVNSLIISKGISGTSDPFLAGGGTATTYYNSGTATTWAVHSFNTSAGTFTFAPSSNITNVQVLVIGGGGGGGGSYGGGGGAGGAVYATGITMAAGSYSITVGAGGAGSSTTGSAGSNSSVTIGGTTYTGTGGGYGASYSGTTTGGNGGCGGGGAGNPAQPGGTGSQGYGGGTGGGGSGGAGGGGMGAAGNNVNTVVGGAGGSGGAGLQYSITGSSIYYAGGGGGGSINNTYGSFGGAGGGGYWITATSTAVAGTNGLGGGGGGATTSGSSTGAAGGFGCVIIAYPLSQFGVVITTLGTITTDTSNNLSIQPVNNISLVGNTIITGNAQISGSLSVSSISTTVLTGTLISSILLNISSINGAPPWQQLFTTSTVIGLGTFGYLSTVQWGSVVSTANLANVVSTANLANLVSTANLANLVSTANLANLVSTANLANLVSTANLATHVSTANLANLVSTANLANLVSTSYLGTQIGSTVIGLGTAGYVSTSQLLSTSLGLNFFISTFYIDYPELLSTVAGLGTTGYLSTGFSTSISRSFLTSSLSTTNINTANVNSLTATISSLTVNALFIGTGTGFTDTGDTIGTSMSTITITANTITAIVLSTQQLNVSSITGITFLSQANLTSTVIGMGTAGYISSGQLVSTSLGLSQYISSFIDPTELTSTVIGLGTQGFVSTLGLTYAVASTAQGLGTFGYTSTSQLLSTSLGLYQQIQTSATAIVQADVTSSITGLGTFGYISTIVWGSVVSTANLANHISTANLANLVSTANLANLVSTANLANLVSTANLANLVSTANLANLVSTANLANLVSTANLANLVSTANLANHISTANLANFVSTAYLSTQLGSTFTTLTVSSLSTFSLQGTTAFISSLTVNGLFIGSNQGFVNMGDVIATSVSSLVVYAGGMYSTSNSTQQAFLSSINGVAFANIGSGGIAGIPSSLNTSSISTFSFQGTTAFISSLTVNGLFIGSNQGFVNMGDVIATSVSSLVIYAGSVYTTSNQASITSTQQLNVSSINGQTFGGPIASTVIGLGTAGYLSTIVWGSVISTANLANLVSTANLANLVSTANLANLVSTANLANLVSTANLANLVSTANLANHISTANLANFVSTTYLSTQLGSTFAVLNVSSFSTFSFTGTTGFMSTLTVNNLYIGSNQGFTTMGDVIGTSLSTILLYTGVEYATNIYVSSFIVSSINGQLFGLAPTVANVVSTANLANLVSTANLANLVSTANLASLVSTTNLANLISTANLANLISTANLANLISTANLANLISTANLANHISTANLANLVSTANLANLVSTTYIATQLGSTVIGLGTVGYISSAQFLSSFNGISLDFKTSSLKTNNVSAATTYVSSMVINTLQIGLTPGFIQMGDIITTSVSTILTTTNLLNAGINAISSFNVYGGTTQAGLGFKFFGSSIQSPLGQAASMSVSSVSTYTTMYLGTFDQYATGRGPSLGFGANNVNGIQTLQGRITGTPITYTGAGSDFGTLNFDVNQTGQMYNVMSMWAIGGPTQAGRVGINCNSPSYNLDVNGSMRVSSTASFTSNVLLTGGATSYLSNSGLFSNVGAATFNSSITIQQNITSIATPSTANSYSLLTLNIPTAGSATTLAPIISLVGGYGASIAGGITQSAGPVLSLGTIAGNGQPTVEGYRMTGTNSVFYGNVTVGTPGSNNTITIQTGGTITVPLGTGVGTLGTAPYLFLNTANNASYLGGDYVAIQPVGNITFYRDFFTGWPATFSSTVNISGRLSNSGVTLFNSTVTLTGGLTNYLSNSGLFSNAGTATFASNVLHTGGATSYLSNSGSLSNAGLATFYSNVQITQTGASIAPYLSMSNYTYGSFFLGMAGGPGQYAFNTVAGDVILCASNAANTTERMFITNNSCNNLVLSNGYVGVNNISPTFPLDVAGGARVAGYGVAVKGAYADNLNSATSYGIGLPNYNVGGQASPPVAIQGYYGVVIQGGPGAGWNSATPTFTAVNGLVGINNSNPSYALDVAGIARSGIPVSSLTGTSATFGANAFGIYYYITNSAFSNIGLYNTSGGATGTGGTAPPIGTGWYVTLRNNTGSYLSITVNGLLASTPASPFTIPPSNSVTIAYDANLAGGAGYVFF